jgi:hypothetical protein
VTSIFAHGDPEHLINNLLFLWIFGLVVEGKVGWWKFAIIYFGIGGLQSMLEQLVMLGYSGDVPGSLGASAAIFGLMAIAAVWAPRNEVTFFWWFYFRSDEFHVSILNLAMFYLCSDLLLIMLTGSSALTSILHLSGAILGLPIGIAMLKLRLVDCEGEDVFHFVKGDYGAFKTEPKPEEVFAKMDQRDQQRSATQLAAAKEQLRMYLKNGNAAAAVLLHEKVKHVGNGLTLDRDELLAIIKGLHTARRWADSAPFMADLLRRFPEGTDAARIRLAQICVMELDRPAKARELLAALDASALRPEHAKLAGKIATKARQMQAEGVVELDADVW